MAWLEEKLAELRLADDAEANRIEDGLREGKFSQDTAKRLVRIALSR